MPLDQSPAESAASAPPPQAQTQAQSQARTPNPSAGRRRRLFTILGLVVAAVAIAYFAYHLLIGSKHVETDDAYVGASTAQVTALVSGAIIQAPVDETQVVKQGQVLAVIEPADYRLAVERARADLDQAQRKVRQYFANDRALVAQTSARNADVAPGPGRAAPRRGRVQSQEVPGPARAPSPATS